MYVWLSNSKINLLSSLTTPFGATVTFDYTPSSAWSRSQTASNHYLPFILQTVSSITVNDGLGNTSTTQYSYSGGWFDFASRELRGFERAVSTKPDGTIVATEFNQDDFLKGRPQWTVSQNTGGQKLGDKIYTWDTAVVGVGATFVKLSRTYDRLYENDTLAATTQEDFIYDDTNGNLLSKTVTGLHAESITTSYSYLNYGTWVWRRTWETVTGSESGTVRQTHFDYYSGTGNLHWEEHWLNGGTNPRISYDYDNYGNRTYVFDAKGNPPTVTDYDPAIHTYPAKVTNPLGQYVELAWDARFGKLDWQTDVNRKLTDCTYDTFGRLIQTDLPDGGRTTAEYIEAVLNSQTGAIITPKTTIARVKEDTAGHTINKRVCVDGLGRTIQVITSGVSAPIVARAYYDAMGRNYYSKGPFFSSGSPQWPMPEPAQYPWRQTYYDDHSRPWKLERPDGAYGTVAVTFAYNGLSTTITDPDNKKKTEIKDYLGRLVRVIEDPGGLNYTTIYDYNAAGNLRHATDHAGNITTINYDTLGRKRNMTDPDMGYWVYTYDVNGNLWTQTDAKDQMISYSYDALNRISTKTYSNGEPTVIYSYDNAQIANGKGRLYSVATPNATTLYGGYDAMGRVKSVSKTIAGDQPRATSFTYDLSGKPLATTYPDGYVVTNSYYTDTGLLWKVTGSAATVFATYSGYDAAGRTGQVDHANGTGTAYTYDVLSGRLQGIVTEDASGLPANDIQRKSYTYTKAGDVKTITDQVRNIPYNYTYDALHRLRTETNYGGFPANSYNYDAIGNITSRFPGTSSYTYAYGPSGGPHAVKEIRVNGTPYAFIYDANGNMTTGWDLTNPTQVATRTITYNADNMPTRIEHSANGATDLVYDGAGSRVKKTSGASITYYVGAHYEIIDGVATKYIFAGGTRVAMVKGTEISYFHQDHLGSSSAMTNAAGQTVETTEHQPYGKIRIKTGTETSNYNFTGQEADPESGLYNYNARLYDPATGMFISADTMVPDFSDPQSLNRYMYARGNPLVYVDPSGHLFGIDDWIIGAVIGALWAGHESDWDVGAMVTGAVIGGVSAGVFTTVTNIATTEIANVVVGTTMADYVANGGLLWVAELGGAMTGGAAAGATAGGLGAAFYGGDIGDAMLKGAGYGAASAAAFKFLEFGWDYAKEYTDASSPTQRYDSRGSKMTAGTRPCEGCSPENQNWFTRAGMEPEGLDHNNIFGLEYNPDSAFGHFINDVSKVHDLFNSWGYNQSGSFAAGSLAYNTAFQTCSFLGMAPAGIYTALTVYGPYVQPAIYFSAMDMEDR